MNTAINQEITLLRDFLDRENEVGIFLGTHQNLDTYAAGLALYLSLTQSGKKVQIISKKAPTVEVSSLVGIDRVKESFKGSTTKLVVALPYIKGEVEKVLFTEAPNTINFHLTAAEGKSITPFELSDVKLNWEGGAPTAIISVGVGTTDEIAAIADPNSTKIVNIDNFQGNTRFGDVVLVDETFSSLSEVVAKVLKELSLPMDADIAQNILDGVLFATRNFTKPNTSPFAFEAVSNAMYQGAKRQVDEPRREAQNMGGQNMGNRQQQQPHQPQQQDRNRDRDRGDRDQRRPNPQARQPRVQDTDFPAMHMQPSAPRQQDQSRDNNRRQPIPQRMPHNQPQRGNQPFPQNNQNRNVDEVRNRLREEHQAQQFDQVDPEDIDRSLPPMQPPVMPVEDTQMPQETSFDQAASEEIPDDWLMPKVFKSSKNNN